MRTILAALLGASVLVSAQAPSSPGPRPAPAPPTAAPAAGQKDEPTGIIRGRILASNGRPVRRASVRILAPTGGFPIVVPADVLGRYEFTKVPAGDYRLTAGKPGYFAIEFGQQRAFEHGTVLTIRNGETLEKIDVTLPVSGAISGRVVDANGDPVEGLDVRLMQLQFAANRRRLLPVVGVGRRLTNDQGRYRLYGIPPGEYMVRASIAADRPAAQTSVILPPGYAATYAPDTPNASDATIVTVGLSEQVDDVDLTLARVATARVSGTVVDSLGKPLAAGIVMNRSQRSGAVSVEPSSTARSTGDGRFEIRDVPAGEFVLQVLTGNDVNQGQEGEFASRFVIVNGTDVTDVRLQTSIGSRVTGRIVFEGNGSADPTGVTISTFPSDFDLSSLGGTPGRAIGRPDGTFVLNGLNGPRRLRLLGAPPSWSLKAIHANGREITDEPLSFGTKDESLTDVEVVLTDKSAGVTGNVTDARGRPAPDYTVIVFATHADRWYQGSRFFTFTRPKADGTFAVADLPPGDYYVAAVDRLQGSEGFGEWQDPAFLESIAPRARRLTLADGQLASVALRLIVR
jgi:protocatechuate 3,4-dioxygenase beta subunit